MDNDVIEEIGIDDKGRLYVAPKTKIFRYIYREAMEIHWDDDGQYLFASPAPRAQLAPPIWWFMRILDAAKEQSCELILLPETKWRNVPPELKEEITSSLAK